MDNLTQRQHDVLAYIQVTLASEGRPPTLLEIARAFGLASPNGVAKHLQALANKGYLVLTPGSSRGIRLAETARRPQTVELPLVGLVAAGEPLFSNGHVERRIAVDRSLFRLHPHYLLRVQGHSMIDAGILDGDLIGVHALRAADHGQIVVARLGDEAITVKRLHRKGRSVRLLPCNPDFAPIDPDPTEDFVIEGLYCGLIRSL